MQHNTAGTTQKEHSMTQTVAQTQNNKQIADNNAIRPFPKVNVPEAELSELRNRINATRWPERETVTTQLKAYNSPQCKHWRTMSKLFRLRAAGVRRSSGR